jgi:MobA/MobL family
MAIYHISVKPVSRAGGRSATAATAYRSGELAHDHTSGEVFDYTRKRGVEHSEIVLPTEAAKRDINWARDREALWNAAEATENRSNSRVAREFGKRLELEALEAGQRRLEKAAELGRLERETAGLAIGAPTCISSNASQYFFLCGELPKVRYIAFRIRSISGSSMWRAWVIDASRSTCKSAAFP